MHICLQNHKSCWAARRCGGEACRPQSQQFSHDLGLRARSLQALLVTLWVPSRYTSFLLQSQNMHWCPDNFKLPLKVNGRLLVWLFMSTLCPDVPRMYLGCRSPWDPAPVNPKTLNLRAGCAVVLVLLRQPPSTCGASCQRRHWGLLGDVNAVQG